MLTNLLLGVSSPDPTIRPAEVPATGADGEFSQVISETAKVSQTIENKEDSSFKQSEAVSLDDSDVQSDPGALPSSGTADSSGQGHWVAMAQGLESGGSISLSDSSQPASQNSSRPAEGELVNPSPAASFRANGRILPESAGSAEAVAAGSSTGQTTGMRSDDVHQSAHLQPGLRSPQHMVSTTSVTQAGAGAESTPRDGARAFDGSSAATQTPPAIVTPPAFNMTSKSGTRSAANEPPTGSGKVAIGTASTVESARDTLRQSSAGSADGKLMVQDDQAGVQRPVSEVKSTVVRDPLNRMAATTHAAAATAGEAVNTQTQARGDSNPAGVSAKVLADRQPLTDAADQSVTTAPPRTTLAARLRQLNATHQSVADNASQNPASTATKVDQVNGSALAGYVGATAGVAQRSAGNNGSVDPGGRERALRPDLRMGDAVPSASSTASGGESLRTDSAILRGESSAALAQLPAQLARQVLHSHAQSVSELRLQLKPEELGSLDLKLRVDGDRVHVAMVAAQPGVKDLLEAQLPQLRQLLEQGGLQLGDVDVAERGSDGHSNPSGAQSTSASARSSGDADMADQPLETASHRPQGLIDAFV